jgi:hypothetical protein
MADEERNDQGIGEGNLRREPGAPPYADRQYADEQEPSGSAQSGTGAAHSSAGGAGVSAQGGSADSTQAGGNAGNTPQSKG